MKLHRITYAKDEEERQEFAASDGAASARITALKKEGGIQGKPEREPVEIPTDKTGLIEWLNTNAYLAVVA
jgi:hypothetical protein